MAENSNIDWCDDTGSPWQGCNEVRLVVSEGVAERRRAEGLLVTEHTLPTGKMILAVPSECDICYAKLTSHRRMGYNGHDEQHPVLWGDPHTTPRHKNKYPQKLIRDINLIAAERGRRLLFTASMSDLFEEHPDVGPWRDEYLGWCQAATNIDHLFLTKRPQNVIRMVPRAWLSNWPQNVWLGLSAGTQAALDLRAHHLMEWRSHGVPVRFLSIEGTLERVDIAEALALGGNWFITGGESGSGFAEDRPRIEADPDWFRVVRDACVDAGVAYFHKQSGGPKPGTGKELDGRLWHQWPDTRLGQVGGVRAQGELVPLKGAHSYVPG